jgi:hypothetical protein
VNGVAVIAGGATVGEEVFVLDWAVGSHDITVKFSYNDQEATNNYITMQA